MANERGSRSSGSGGGGGLLSNFRSNRNSTRQNSEPSDPSPNSSSSSSYLPDPSALLKDLAPNLLSSSSRLLHPSNLHAHQQSLISSSSSQDASTIESLRRKLSFLKTGLSIDNKNGSKISWGQLSQDLYIRDRVEELLNLPVPPAPFQFTSTPNPSSLTSSSSVLTIEAPLPPAPRADEVVPLIQGFQATIPTSNQARFERRKKRALESELRLGLKQGGKLGLKERGEKARGLLGNVREEEEGEEGGDGLRIGRKSIGDNSTGTVNTTKGSLPPPPSRVELENDLKAVGKDMNNVAVRRALLNGQIRDVESKIKELEGIRDGFRKSLLGLREEELELEDESKLSLPYSLHVLSDSIADYPCGWCSGRYSSYFS